MSNIYITEPPTHGKVLLETSVGEIEIELWARECPKACRNFVQLCMERYYDKTKFHRIVRDFIAQGKLNSDYIESSLPKATRRLVLFERFTTTLHFGTFRLTI